MKGFAGTGFDSPWYSLKIVKPTEVVGPYFLPEAIKNKDSEGDSNAMNWSFFFRRHSLKCYCHFVTVLFKGLINEMYSGIARV